MRPHGERALKENTVESLDSRGWQGPLVREHELRELGREELQVARGGLERLTAVERVLDPVEAGADVAPPPELVAGEDVGAVEVAPRAGVGDRRAAHDGERGRPL